MFAIAYYAPQEQFAPSQLLRFVELAEQAGFTALHSSDHVTQNAGFKNVNLTFRL